MTKQIALSRQGKHAGKYFAIVDNEDFDRVNAHRWHAHSFFNGKPKYAYASVNGKKFVNMALFILRLDNQEMVDHINGDGMNNTRNNLRICTMSENNANRRIQRNNSTGFRGVVRRNMKYQAAIVLNRKNIYIGTFDTAEAAARAYDAKAIELFGEFARLNFPQAATS